MSSKKKSPAPGKKSKVQTSHSASKQLHQSQEYDRYNMRIGSQLDSDSLISTNKAHASYVPETIHNVPTKPANKKTTTTAKSPRSAGKGNKSGPSLGSRVVMAVNGGAESQANASRDLDAMEHVSRYLYISHQLDIF